MNTIKRIVCNLLTLAAIVSICPNVYANGYTRTVMSVGDYSPVSMCTISNVYNDQKVDGGVRSYFTEGCEVILEDKCDDNTIFYIPDIQTNDECKSAFSTRITNDTGTFLKPEKVNKLDKIGAYYFILASGDTSQGDYTDVHGVRFFVIVTPPQDTSLNNGLNVTALKTTSNIAVDNKNVNFNAYNIKNNNFFKLRDLSKVLSGTTKNFNVEYDESIKQINITTKEDYNGDKSLSDVVTKDKAEAIPKNTTIYIDGTPTNFKTYNVDGFNYVKLRDIAPYIGFEVFWSAGTDYICIATEDEGIKFLRENYDLI